MRTDTCARCGKRIHLLKLSPTNFKWVANPDDKDTWKCEPTPEHPARSHAPVSMQASHR